MSQNICYALVNIWSESEKNTGIFTRDLPALTNCANAARQGVLGAFQGQPMCQIIQNCEYNWGRILHQNGV